MNSRVIYVAVRILSWLASLFNRVVENRKLTRVMALLAGVLTIAGFIIQYYETLPEQNSIISPFSERKIVFPKRALPLTDCYALAYVDLSDLDSVATSIVVEALDEKIRRLEKSGSSLNAREKECLLASRFEHIDRRRAAELHQAILNEEPQHIGSLLGMARLTVHTKRFGDFIRRAIAAAESTAEGYALPYILWTQILSLPGDTATENVNQKLSKAARLAEQLRLGEFASLMKIARSILAIPKAPQAFQERMFRKYLSNCSAMHSRDTEIMCTLGRARYYFHQDQKELSRVELQKAIDISEKAELWGRYAALRLVYAKNHLTHWLDREKYYLRTIEKAETGASIDTRQQIWANLANIASFSRQNPKLAYQRMGKAIDLTLQFPQEGVFAELSNRGNRDYALRQVNYALRAKEPENATEFLLKAIRFSEKLPADYIGLKAHLDILGLLATQLETRKIVERSDFKNAKLSPKFSKSAPLLKRKWGASAETGKIASLINRYGKILDRLKLETSSLADTDMNAFLRVFHGSHPIFTKGVVDKYCRSKEFGKDLRKYTKKCFDFYRWFVAGIRPQQYTTPYQQGFSVKSDEYDKFVREYRRLNNLDIAAQKPPKISNQNTARANAKPLTEAEKIDKLKARLAVSDYIDVSKDNFSALWAVEAGLDRAVKAEDRDSAAKYLSILEQVWRHKVLAAYQWNGILRRIVKGNDFLRNHRSELNYLCAAYAMSHWDSGWFQDSRQRHLLDVGFKVLGLIAIEAKKAGGGSPTKEKADILLTALEANYKWKLSDTTELTEDSSRLCAKSILEKEESSKINSACSVSWWMLNVIGKTGLSLEKYIAKLKSNQKRLREIAKLPPTIQYCEKRAVFPRTN